ncbi:MAG: maleate isomerase [Actinomycetota bacterium]|nr:maleate isomerase [Actinomycetota bacterium]
MSNAATAPAPRPEGTIGYRAKFGVITPSTNTAVESDYNTIRPPGVTFHVGRMWIQSRTDNDEEADRTLRQMRETIDTAIRDVVTCQPDRLICGMSSETFMGGLEGNTKFIKHAEEISGLEVTTGADSVSAALDHYGARKIAVLTPYQQVIDVQVEKFFADLGYDLVRMKGLRVPTALSAALIPPDDLREVLRELNGSDVDAIVQAGANLSLLEVVEDMERELEKPIVALNVATVWHALRAVGINDQFGGFGSLFSQA